MENTIINTRSQAVRIICELKEKLSESFFNLNPWEIKKDNKERIIVNQILTNDLDNIPLQEGSDLKMFKDNEQETLTRHGELVMNINFSLDRNYINQLSLSIDSLVDFIIETNDRELADYLLTCSEAIQEWELIFFLFKCNLYDKKHDLLSEALFPLEDFFQQDHKKINVYCSDESACDELLWYFKNKKDILNRFIKNIDGVNDDTVIAKVNYCYENHYLNVEKNAKGKYSVKSFHYCLQAHGYYNKSYKTFNDYFGEKGKSSKLL